MVITTLEKLNGSKIKVYIDDEYAFLLYQKDINRYHLEEGNEISPEIYNEIIEDTVFRRAKQKALAVLKYMDRTEFELRKKLSDTGYPIDIINQTISFVMDYKYLDDDRYAANYIRINKNTKSIRLMKMELQTKGIKKDMIENILIQEYDDSKEDPEEIAILKIIKKKTLDINSLSWDEKQKLMAQLYRKGFDIDKIKRLLQSNE